MQELLEGLNHKYPLFFSGSRGLGGGGEMAWVLEGARPASVLALGVGPAGRRRHSGGNINCTGTMFRDGVFVCMMCVYWFPRPC